MRILVAALGSPGHAFPLVPLATALREAGHEVTVAVGPDVLEAIGSTGLDTVSAGGRLRDGFEVIRRRHGMTDMPRDPERIRPLAAEAFGDVFARTAATDLVPWVSEHRPDLVVAEIGNPGAALAAASAGVPCVLHGFGRRPGPEAPMHERATHHVAALAAELGLDVGAGAALGHAYLDVCPPALRAPARGDELPELPLRPTPWNPPVADVAPPAPGRDWVYLTLGTAWGRAGVLRTVAGALAGLGPDVLVAAGSAEVAELDGVADERVRVEPFVPQADLLMSDHPPLLAVHHGGSGTTLAAAAAGIPQLVVPQGADQFVNAGAITAVRAGATVDARTDDAATITRTARALLDDGPARHAARALAAEIAAMPSPADVAARVEQWGRPAR